MKRILIVDDQNDNLIRMMKAIQNQERQIFLAQNASEAIRLIKKIHFDYVVTDMIMPEGEYAGVSVYDAAEAAAAKSKQKTEVTIITAFGNTLTTLNSERDKPLTWIDKNEEDPYAELQKRITNSLDKQGGKH